MNRGDARNAGLSQASILAAAGGVLVAVAQRAPELSAGLAGKALLALGGLLIAGALVLALRSLWGGR